MATLHNVTEDTRKILIGIGIFFGSFLLIVFTVRIYSNLKSRNAPPPPPTHTYGKLPAIGFPQKKMDKSFTFTVDTITGLLPDFPDREPVYQILQPIPDLNELTIIQAMINNTEFGNQQPIGLSETLFMWTTANPPYKKLTFDKLYKDFTLISNYATDPSVLEAAHLGSTDDAINTAKDFFTSLGSFPVTLDQTKTTTSIFNIANSQLVPVDKIADAKIIRVDFFYQDQVGYPNDQSLPIYYPHSPNSIISALVGSNDTGQQIVEAHYTTKQLNTDTTTINTYAIKSAKQALIDLQNGNGYLVSYNGNTNIISIENVFLAYYMDESRQSYLMPIEVFVGKDGFMAYVSAITDQWIDTANAGK